MTAPTVHHQPDTVFSTDIDPQLDRTVNPRIQNVLEAMPLSIWGPLYNGPVHVVQLNLWHRGVIS